MRTESSIKNLTYAFGGQIIGILISLVARWVFIYTLNVEYLGLNELFTNISLVLSLVELGIGPAMTFSLYKPLAENNREKIKSLMNLYKKAYTIIGILVFVLGLALIPTLPFFIDTMPNIPESIILIYILFVTNTAISYFFAYKRSLIISDQKRYIDTAYRYIFYSILNILQIIVLVLTRNYILFLVVQVIMTLIENISVSLKVNKLYPYITEQNIKKLETHDMSEIKKNVGAMVFHKIGGAIVFGLDNIIISKFIGLVAVGIYANYLLIVNALNIVIGQIFSSITASVGNLGVTENKDKQLNIFNKTFFMNFWIYAFVSTCLLVLFNNFIYLWVGEEFVFDIIIVAVIVLNVYLLGMRKSVLTFKDALGLFWYDRYKPLFEAGLNVIVSLVLVHYLGIIGVFIGTTISTILTCFWVEPYVLYKYGFEKRCKSYFAKYVEYFLVTIIVGAITVFSCILLFPNTDILSFVGKLSICITIPNICILGLYHKSEEFIYLLNLLKNTIKIKS